MLRSGHFAADAGEGSDMRESIQFLLGEDRRKLAGIAPMATVPDWLRGDARRPGTREACNGGDCGACTAAAARPEGDGLSYRPVSACIQLARRHKPLGADLPGVKISPRPSSSSSIPSAGSRSLAA